MGLRRHLVAVGLALATLVIAVVATASVAGLGHDGAPALVLLVALTVVGGAIADWIEHPSAIDAAAMVLLLTVLGWLWQYAYPSGEQPSTDWFSRGGWALLAIAFTALYFIGSAAHAAASRR